MVNVHARGNELEPIQTFSRIRLLRQFVDATWITGIMLNPSTFGSLLILCDKMSLGLRAEL